MFQLRRAAEELGFEVEARRGTWDSLTRALREGGLALLHVDGNHFVASITCRAGDRVRVADPSRGVRDLNAAEFQAAYGWKGAMLVLKVHNAAQADEP
jgi:ABC-type bacteriocin/lantibiotic exporter with double-glycine peptidase domain